MREFKIFVDWKKEEEFRLTVHDFPEILVGPSAPEGQKPLYITPIDLFIGSIATCIAITFKKLCDKGRVELVDLKVEASGPLTPVPEESTSRVEEVNIKLYVVLNDEKHLGKVKRFFKLAREKCPIGYSIAGSPPVKAELKAYVLSKEG